MDIKDYGDINIPKDINKYIDKGIEKGIEHKNEKKNNISYNMLKNISAIAIISTLTLVTVSNVPIVASELVNKPILGDLVHILDFTHSTEIGGMITDGNKIVIDSLEEDTINIYFTNNNELIKISPPYVIKYRKYPYTIELSFDGVRYLNFTYIEDKIKRIPYVKDVYRIMTLDDSNYRIAIELNENLEFEAYEYENPGLVSIKMIRVKDEETRMDAYFIRTRELENGEMLGHLEEKLSKYEKTEIQKTQDNKFVIQLGPYTNHADASYKMEQIINDENNEIDLYIEERKLGEGPK